LIRRSTGKQPDRAKPRGLDHLEASQSGLQ